MLNIGSENKDDISLPVVFVHKGLQDWDDLKNTDELPEISELNERLRGGRDVWIITAYIVLKSIGCNVKLLPDFMDGAICIAHYDDIDPSNYPFNSYVVSIRADRDRTFICDMEIVQNPSSIESRRAIFIPHWPQPGIISRNPDRGADISRLAYFGVERNLALRFKSSEFKQELENIGVSLIVKDREWNNYSDVDIVLAIRDGSDYFFASKPASKLINAWLGMCPAIVGEEPGYKYLQSSDTDFFIATTPGEVIEIIRRLKADPSFYNEVVRNGKLRANDYTVDKITKIWVEYIFGCIKDDFITWRKTPDYFRRIKAHTKYVYRYTRRLLRGRKYVRGYDKKGQIVKYGLVRRIRNRIF